MLVPNPHPMLVKEIAQELDLDKDGEIDLWEFCVHMQKREDGITKADLETELDFAFSLFDADPTGHIDLAEIRRLMQNKHTGCPLGDPEMEALIDDLDARFGGLVVGGSLRDGGKVPVKELRAHPCFAADDGLQKAVAAENEDDD